MDVRKVSMRYVVSSSPDGPPSSADTNEVVSAHQRIQLLADSVAIERIVQLAKISRRAISRQIECFPRGLLDLADRVLQQDEQHQNEDDEKADEDRDEQSHVP